MPNSLVAKALPPNLVIMDDDFWENFKNFFRIRSALSIYFYSILVGAIAGLLAVVFSYGLAWSEYFSFEYLVGLGRVHPAGEIAIHGHPATEPHRWLLFVLPVIGGFLVGLILQFVYADANGAGTDSFVHSFHHKEGYIPARGGFYKSLATILTLSSGGSGGREGPTAYLGAGIGSRVARSLGAGPRARRTLLLVGVAGALGAIFRAPLGGAVTAVEIIYREDIESDALIPCIMSSVSGYLIFSLLAGQATLFDVPIIPVGNFRDLWIYAILGIICYGVGLVYVAIYHRTMRFFDSLQFPRFTKPAIAGVVVGILGYNWPELLGSSMGVLQATIHGQGILSHGHQGLDLALLFLGIAGLKIIATSFTIGSGGSGGLFAPSLFIGAMLGGGVVSIANLLLPGWNLPLVPFMLVGMGAFFAGVARAPIASMIMVGDMIGSYRLLPPLMIVSVITLVLSHRHSWSLYLTQVDNRFHSPAHFWDMELDLLAQIRISDQFPRLNKMAVIKSTDSLKKMEAFAKKKYISEFIVLERDGSYYGILSLNKPLKSRYKHRSSQQGRRRTAPIVREYTNTDIPPISYDATLSEALQHLTEYNVDKVAVLDPKTKKFLGYIRYQHIVSAYQKCVKNKEKQGQGKMS